ncbi:FkbM family methyltransferase [Ensifer sp. YR511]|uniref:FkbM family methyltransferase n=1 Tax=Ensifer sp. YR511 TaxID=1855294 RepID=UPI00088694BB|nr:FkbM family methyltransferase [Ensifer sp. YR511]SDO24393.1 methyltransferase, FkbM family [Ensifer sp. YR511]
MKFPIENLNSNQIFIGYNYEDTDRLVKYMEKDLQPIVGFHIDCFGIKTRYTFFRPEGGTSVHGELPFPDNRLYGEMIEILATCFAVEAGSKEMVVYELGAGFAPWLVCTANFAMKRGVSSLRLVAVEADPERLPLINTHFADNCLPRSDQNQPSIKTEIVHAGVSDVPGSLHFSAQGIHDWGGGVTEAPTSTDYRGIQSRSVLIPALPIATLLANEVMVDLIHMDIQGYEYKSVAASLDAINSKVKSMIIGTHSRVIEGQLIDLLRRSGWLLVFEKPCKFHTASQLPDVTGATYFDGTQFWVNERLWPSDYVWTGAQ